MIIAPRFWLRLKAWWNGRRDGRLGIPKKDSRHPSQWEKEIKNQFQAGARNIVQEFQKKESVWSQEHRNLLKQKDQALKGLKTADGTMASEGRTETDAKISKGAYICAMILLTLLEIPFNAKVFDIFGEAIYISYVIATFLSLILLGLSHILGLWIRHKENPKGRIAITVLVFLVLTACSIVRAVFTTQDGGTISFGLAMFLFWGLNSAIFMLEVFLIMASTDSKLLFEKSHKKSQGYNYTLAALENSITKVSAQRISNFSTATQEMASQQDLLRSLVAIYRSANLRTRKDGEEVSYFEEEIKLEDTDHIRYMNPQPEIPNYETPEPDKPEIVVLEKPTFIPQEQATQVPRLVSGER